MGEVTCCSGWQQGDLTPKDFRRRSVSRASGDLLRRAPAEFRHDSEYIFWLQILNGRRRAR